VGSVGDGMDVTRVDILTMSPLLLVSGESTCSMKRMSLIDLGGEMPRPFLPLYSSTVLDFQ
jgi:hypothetical protein